LVEPVRAYRRRLWGLRKERWPIVDQELLPYIYIGSSEYSNPNNCVAQQEFRDAVYVGFLGSAIDKAGPAARACRVHLLLGVMIPYCRCVPSFTIVIELEEVLTDLQMVNQSATVCFVLCNEFPCVFADKIARGKAFSSDETQAVDCGCC
jgi:hypothetical protein